MHSTFAGMALGASELSAPTSPEPPQPPKPRPKRSQVARACDWCRVHRIKCDNHLPCSNCRKRKGQCSQGELEIRTLPHAYRKIEHLENRVRELEQELENKRKARPGSGLHTPQSTPASSGHSDPGNVGAPSPSTDYGANNTERKKLHEGIQVRTSRSQQETWYGPSSLFYFIRRVNTCLNNSLRQTRPLNHMLPDSANKLCDGPAQPSTKDQVLRPAPTMGADLDSKGDYLTPTQEEYFISLFWQSYHTSLAILDEAAFKEHYQSLWTTSSRERKPSALVDIVIALCLQHGVALRPGAGTTISASPNPKADNNDATTAGRGHYQRCQRLLMSELENPTLMTLQCHILSLAYLCSGSFPNMADSTCALAVRTAYMLGLHLDPPQELPQRERELRKRLLWALYILDSKISMKLGRPFLLDHHDVTSSLPGDGQETAALSGSMFPPLGENATWLTFNLQHVKLFLAVRTAYTSFYKKHLSTDGPAKDTDSRDDSKIVESHAEYLGPHLDRIEEWVKDVPSIIKTDRQDNGIPFSTDLSSLEIEQFASPWLQRQRLLLELMYHNLCINLFRPFIRFTPMTTPTPLADKIATDCAAHAITLTRIMHQVVSSTTILTGWHEAFQWQWNAAMTLIGFVVAYPQHPSTPTARNAIDLSIAVFEFFARSLATAASAVVIARDLGAQADVLTEQAQDQGQGRQDLAEGASLATGNWGLSDNGSLTNSSLTPAQTPAGTWTGDDTTAVPMQDMFAGSMDLSYPMDTQDFGMLLWSNMGGDPAMQWQYPQLQV
ncbi:fungal-specific transcription factor domain-containing protein [Hypoxylon sp. NC1633]|nr:fungal-specific transcription factor domain-containing protein [Hypoxylon sp. NC1633]